MRPYDLSPLVAEHVCDRFGFDSREIHEQLPLRNEGDEFVDDPCGITDADAYDDDVRKPDGLLRARDRTSPGDEDLTPLRLEILLPEASESSGTTDDGDGVGFFSHCRSFMIIRKENTMKGDFSKSIAYFLKSLDTGSGGVEKKTFPYERLIFLGTSISRSCRSSWG